MLVSLISVLSLLATTGLATPVDRGLGDHAVERSLEERAEQPYRIIWAGAPPDVVQLAFLKMQSVAMTYKVKYNNGDLPQVGHLVRNRYQHADWTMDPTKSGPIKMSDDYGNTLCLDAGSHPQNGNTVHLWSCFGSTQQKWVVRGNAVKLQNFDLCLDVRDGQADKGAQVWQCAGNQNQNWNVKLNA